MFDIWIVGNSRVGKQLAFGRNRVDFRHLDGNHRRFDMPRSDDLGLLALLKANAREPVATLARKLGVARTTIQERLRRLEANGTIAGYTIRLGGDRSGHRVAARVLLKVDPKRGEAVVRSLRAMPYVDALHSVSGAFDYIADCGHDNTAKLDELLDQIGRITGIERTETLVLLATRFER